LEPNALARVPANACHHGRRGGIISTLSRLIAALAWSFAAPAWSAKWDIVPSLQASETYTDNVQLTTNAGKKSDWVTQVTPAILITATGADARFRLNYAPQATYYANGLGSNRWYQRGDLFGSAKLAGDYLYLDVGGSVNQYNVSLRGPITISNINTTGNLSTVSAFFVSPYLRHNFGSEAWGEARYTYSLTNSNAPAQAQDSEANAIDLRLASGPAHKLFTWDVSYFNQAIDYKSALSPDVDSEVALLDVRRLVTSTVGLLAQGGYEDYTYGFGGLNSENGSRWGVGFDWTPSSRTRLAALIGRRFFGDAYFLDFSTRTRLLSVKAGYIEDVTTTRAGFLAPNTSSTAGYLDPFYCYGNADPIACQQQVNAFTLQRGLPANLAAPVNNFANQPFLSKRWSASVATQGVRNIIIANLFTDSRTPLPGIIANLPVNQANKQLGVSFAWNLRLTARDTWNLFGGYTRNKFPDTGRTDDLFNLNIGFRRQFQPKFSGSLYYRRQQNDSTNPGADFQENAVIGTLDITF